MTRRTLRLLTPQVRGADSQLDASTVRRLRSAAWTVKARQRQPDDRRATHSVYVALLRGVPQDPDEYSLYVGSTGLPPEARYWEHSVGIKSPRKWIMRYGLGLLPQLTRRFNPMPYTEAKQTEEELIAAFKGAGFSVHGK